MLHTEVVWKNQPNKHKFRKKDIVSFSKKWVDMALIPANEISQAHKEGDDRFFSSSRVQRG